MIICPACDAENIENTLFCSECGHYLAEHESPMTDAVGMQVGELAINILDNSDEQQAPGTGPLGINLVIGEPGRSLQMPLSKPIQLGRLDPSGNIFPEVDLSVDGGAEKGVSRRHARILKRDHQIYVEDLGSSNGTFVNGQKLMPYFPELLSDGDAIRLGKLEIKVALSQRL